MPTDAELEQAKQAQRSAWNVASENYGNMAKKAPWFKAIYKLFVDKVIEHFGKDKPFKLLDVAAAVGEPGMTIAAALPAAMVISTDLAPENKIHGQKYAQELGLTNVSFDTADAENLEAFEDASFDIVTCSLGLMFCPTHQKALAEFRRVLKPGGLLLASVWGPGDRSINFSSMLEFSKRTHAPTNPAASAVKFGDPSQLLQDMGAAGFGACAAREVSLDMSLGAEEWSFVLYGTPMLAGLKARQAAGEADVFQQAEEVLKGVYKDLGALQPDGSVSLPGNPLNFICATAV